MRVRTYSKVINRYGVSITKLEVIILFNSMWEDFVIRLFVNKKHQRDADQHTLYLIDAQRKAIDLLEKAASDAIHHETCRYVAFLNGEESE